MRKRDLQNRDHLEILLIGLTVSKEREAIVEDRMEVSPVPESKNLPERPPSALMEADPNLRKTGKRTREEEVDLLPRFLVTTVVLGAGEAGRGTRMPVPQGDDVPGRLPRNQAPPDRGLVLL